MIAGSRLSCFRIAAKRGSGGRYPHLLSLLQRIAVPLFETVYNDDDAVDDVYDDYYEENDADDETCNDINCW